MLQKCQKTREKQNKGKKKTHTPQEFYKLCPLFLTALVCVDEEMQISDFSGTAGVLKLPLHSSWEFFCMGENANKQSKVEVLSSLEMFCFRGLIE